VTSVRRASSRSARSRSASTRPAPGRVPRARPAPRPGARAAPRGRARDRCSLPARAAARGASAAAEIHVRPRRAEERADAPGRDPVLVEVLGIDAEPGARVVPEQGAALCCASSISRSRRAPGSSLSGGIGTSGLFTATISIRLAISAGGARPSFPGSHASTRSPRGRSSRQSAPASSGNRETVMPERSRSRSTVSYSWTVPTSRSARSRSSSGVPGSRPCQSP
jgi:hypothetical protein